MTNKNTYKIFGKGGSLGQLMINIVYVYSFEMEIKKQNDSFKSIRYFNHLISMLSFT